MTSRHLPDASSLATVVGDRFGDTAGSVISAQTSEHSTEPCDNIIHELAADGGAERQHLRCDS
jgi:hypothetical protein